MSISILQVKDENGNWIPIPAIKGDKGDPGKDGLTPFIGANGNWYIGTLDTGVKAVSDVQVATGSYQGTGNNTIVLSFNFVPKCILIDGGYIYGGGWEYGFLNPQAGTGVGIANYSENETKIQKITCSVSGNTVSASTLYNILSAGSPNVAMYNYVAIG